MKRPFFRHHGQIVDSYERADGRRESLHVPACMFGEDLPEGDRKSFLQDLGSRSETEGRSIFALACDTSQEKVEGLLKSLEAGNIAAPMELLRFLDDPRVQPALVEAARRAPAADVANFAQVVGLVGGPGAREVLRQRLRELEGEPKVFEDDNFHNSYAGSLQSVAEHLLRLEPDAEDAADILIRLAEHPCASNRDSAVWAIARTLDNELCVGVGEKLGRYLRQFLLHDDAGLFLRAAPALFRRAPRAVLRRLEKILENAAEAMRERAFHMLTGAPAGLALRAIPLLIRRVESEQSLRLKVHIAKYLGRLAPQASLTELAQTALNHESPSLRLDAISLLDLLTREEAHGLAERALMDEPDEVLKRGLLRYVRR